MDLHRAIGEFLNQGRHLCKLLQSPEGNTATDLDLHTLKVQLYLLESESTKIQLQRSIQAKKQASGS